MTDLHVAAMDSRGIRVADDNVNRHSSLIPGLLDDIVLYEIVCRLPWYIRPLLTLLSKAWSSALRQPAAFSARTRTLQKLHGLLLVHAQSPLPRNNAEDNIRTLNLNFNSSSLKLLATESGNLKQVRTISILDSASNRWRKLPPIPGFRSSVLYEQRGVVCLDGKVFVIGGYDPAISLVSGDVYVLDLRSGFWQWRQLPALRYPRYAPKCTAVPGKVYVLGGYSSHEDSPSSYVRFPEVYDVEKDRWNLLPALPSEEEFSCRGVLPLIEDQNIFAYGRSFEDDNWDENPVKIARIYDSASEKWTTMEFDYSSCCAVVCGYFHDIRAGVLYRYKTTSAENRTALKGRLPIASNGADYGCCIARELISGGDDKPHELYVLVRGGDGDGSECERLLRGSLNECEDEVSWHTVTTGGFSRCCDGSQILYLN